MKACEIAELVDGELFGNGDVEIFSVASLASAQPHQITFIEKPESFSSTEASCVIVPVGFNESEFGTVIKVVNPKLAFARTAAILHKPKQRSGEIHPSAVISSSANVGDNVFLGAFCCVGEGTRIGDETQLRAGAKVGDNVTIGANCVLHSNVF